MGNLAHPIYHAGGYSPYAPQWARDPYARHRSHRQTADLAEDNLAGTEESIGSILARAGDPLRPEKDLSVSHFLERSLQPDFVPYPLSNSPRPPLLLNVFDILCGSIVGVAAGVALTFFLVGKFPPPQSIGASDRPGAASFAARFVGQTSAGPTAGRISPASALSNSPVETSAERRL